jgi:hypothetical protein
MKSWQSPAIILGAIFVGLILVGRHTNAGRPPVRVHLVFDATIGDRLATARSREATLLSRLDPGDRAAVYLLDQECVEVFSPDQPLPSGLDSTLQMLIERVKPSPRHGTFPYKAWKKLAQQVRRDTLPTILIWESDGDEDQPGESARRVTQQAIHELAALPQVRLVVQVGVNKEQRERVRRELTPFGNRYAIVEKNESVSHFTEIVENALTPTPRKGDTR